MARGGRDISGWVVVDKPAGLTSTAVVGKLRRAFGARKAGHCGTLDPDATGVLAVALGEATKTIPHVTEGPKSYRFAMRLGAATTTDDASGTVLATSPARPTEADIRAALPAFTGIIAQVPPQYSAVKVGGERAYDLARAGQALDLAARPLSVERLDLVERPDPDTVILDLVCGKGGYVRAIARDLGAQLGCLGHVLWLRRLATGPFNLEASLPLDRILDAAAAGATDGVLLPLQAGLAGLPEVTATEEGAARIAHGNPGTVRAPGIASGTQVWVSHGGRPIALGRLTGSEVHPSRVFNL
ncbi:MAG: tRNA pseudouridine(55) synthase TruB [Rhodobacteraceae bacterium]|nr:tRNA pseudouridine(55) synthase TruB [Paracoccaceae bacterium]